MNIICPASLKGGVMKSSLTILLAKYFSQIKKERTLVIDLDSQNSTSSHFVPYDDERNIAKAIFETSPKENMLKSNIIEISDTLHIVQSSLKLAKMQSLPPKTLKSLLAPIQDDYTWCVIDTHPDYGATETTAIYAADLIITPVSLECAFDFKTSMALREFISTDYPELLPKWKILLNRVRESRGENSMVNQYLQLFTTNFDNILDTRIPETKQIGQLIDSKSKLKDTKMWDKIYPALTALVEEINTLIKGVK